jgi:hypothetical protein
MKTLQGMIGLAGLALVVVACGGGGPLVTTTSGDGRDDPGTTRDTPPSTSDNAGGGDCLVCDVVYDCPNAGNLGNGLSLNTSDGTCTQNLINVVCSGSLFGTAPCTGGGGGPFTCGSITCTPEVQSGSSGGSSGSSSGATPGGGTGFADAG